MCPHVEGRYAVIPELLRIRILAGTWTIGSFDYFASTVSTFT